MDMHAAYREVGSYRAAADICGTTPKTVKRSVEAAKRAESGAVPGEVRHNYDSVAELVAESVTRTKGRISAKRLLPTAQGRRLQGLIPQLPTAGGRIEGHVEVEEPPGQTTGRVGPR